MLIALLSINSPFVNSEVNTCAKTEIETPGGSETRHAGARTYSREDYEVQDPPRGLSCCLLPTAALQRCGPIAIVQAHISPILRATGQFHHLSSPALGGPHSLLVPISLPLGQGVCRWVQETRVTESAGLGDAEAHPGWVRQVCTKPWAAVTNEACA